MKDIERTISPFLVCQSDLSGGAARAAYRLHTALRSFDVPSSMMVGEKRSDDRFVIKRRSACTQSLRFAFGQQIMRLQRSNNPNLRSGNWLPSAWAQTLNQSKADVINLHWVAGEALSIEDIGRIRKPVVWTLHDMWPFCGTEHYISDDAKARWRVGYRSDNRSPADGGFDIDRLVWRRKQRAWKKHAQIIAPSRWLADCARQSALFRDWPVSVIPNLLDTQVYKPLDRAFCRGVLNLPQDKKIILFGAIHGGRNPIKGFDLLLKALNRLATQMDMDKVLCVVFGQTQPHTALAVPIATHWMGHIHDDPTLALLYNAADVTVVPSLQEAFGQTASEPQACGCPVVAFNCTGLPDIIVHQETGYLAEAFDADDMAVGIRWILETQSRRARLGDAARKQALQLWAPEVVVPQYLELYKNVAFSRSKT
jgi:glycosyltransferase involved in cell wall biosynthesis